MTTTTPDPAPSPPKCPKCGALIRTNYPQDKVSAFDCGSVVSPAEDYQSTRCRIDELEQQLAAARNRIGELEMAMKLTWQGSPTKP
jgi:hypothetical protein